MTTKIDRVFAPNKNAALAGDFYTVPGTYQSILSPRMSNVSYGSMRYNMPDLANQAVPVNPLDYGQMIGAKQVTENYCKGGAGAVPFQGGHQPTEPGFANGDFNSVVDGVYGSSDTMIANNLIPVSDMTSMGAASGDQEQPYFYDRYIYANRNSRLRSQGDPIRGDIAITPNAPGWFTPSVHPNIDLHPGAMNVLAGNNNDSANELAALIAISSGGYDTTSGGVNMAHELQPTLSALGIGDVNVQAF